MNQCEDQTSLKLKLVYLAETLGFDSVLYGGRFTVDGFRTVEHVESNYQTRWFEIYAQEGFEQIDPTVTHAMHSVAPLIWSDSMLRSPRQRQFGAAANSFGLVTGVSIPVHSREGDVGLLNLSSSESGALADRLVRSNLAWAALIGQVTHEAMRRIVKRTAWQSRPRLTQRESEVLRWLAAGKSTWDTSMLLGISEHGVVHHVRNLLDKFEVPTRRQAIAKAAALGML
jgi:LuxR family quorum-sensing transcriptional regulator LasR